MRNDIDEKTLEKIERNFEEDNKYSLAMNVADKNGVKACMQDWQAS